LVVCSSAASISFSLSSLAASIYLGIACLFKIKGAYISRAAFPEPCVALLSSGRLRKYRAHYEPERIVRPKVTERVKERAMKDGTRPNGQRSVVSPFSAAWSRPSDKGAVGVNKQRSRPANSETGRDKGSVRERAREE
jgi:hypothetical protein